MRYTQTFLWLQRYDKGLLTDPRGHPGGEVPSVAEARAGIAALKADLIAKGQASALFGNEREDGLAVLLGNLDQTVFGEPAYPTLESRAAHLLHACRGWRMSRPRGCPPRTPSPRPHQHPRGKGRHQRTATLDS